MATVQLGNVKPHSWSSEKDKFVPIGSGNQVTTVNIPADYTVSQAFIAITDANGVWKNHSDDAPAWVETDDETLSVLLSSHYGCSVGRPKEWNK